MIIFTDITGNKIEKGFYVDWEQGDNTLYYFTGEYANELPLFDVEGTVPVMKEKEFVNKISPLDKKYIRNITSVLQNKINWLEKKLKEI